MTRNNSISGQIMASDNQIWTKVFFWKQLLHLPVNCAGVNTSNIFPYQNFQFFFFFYNVTAFLRLKRLHLASDENFNFFFQKRNRVEPVRLRTTFWSTSSSDSAGK